MTSRLGRVRLEIRRKSDFLVVMLVGLHSLAKDPSTLGYSRTNENEAPQNHCAPCKYLRVQILAAFAFNERTSDRTARQGRDADNGQPHSNPHPCLLHVAVETRESRLKQRLGSTSKESVEAD